jgi:hypothetical protein
VWLAASAMPERRARCWYLLGPVSASLRFTSFVFSEQCVPNPVGREREREGDGAGASPDYLKSAPGFGRDRLHYDEVIMAVIGWAQVIPGIIASLFLRAAV